MKAIIIEETRFKEICDLMESKAKDLKNTSPSPERLRISKETFGIIANEVHGAIHYEFVTWAQSHGASCIK